KANYALTDAVIRRPLDLNVRHLWVRYPTLDALESLLSLDALRVQQGVVRPGTAALETLQQSASAKLDITTYTTAITAMVEHLATHRTSAVFLGDLAEAGDELMRHSSNVAYLALLLGMKLETYIVRQRRRINGARAKD